MKDIKEKLLFQAKNFLLKGDVSSFTKTIIELYNNHFTCNFFLREQKDEYWQTLKTSIEKFIDDADNFALNFAKGFIYLMCKEESKAYTYLSKAINNSPTNDIVYTLRATIDSGINKHNIEDAEVAVGLNPSARNYFVLAGSFNNGRENESLKYYEKSIELYHKCKEIWPHNFAALHYLRLSENALVSSAIKDYKNKNYNETEKKFELLFKYDKSLSEDHVEIYLSAKIKAKYPNINLGIENPFYIIFCDLIKEYHRKVKCKISPTEDEKNASKLIQYKSEDIIYFGQYTGEKIIDIIKRDPRHILWLTMHACNFSISNTLLINDVFKNQNHYLLAIEVNIIKTKIIKKQRYIEDEEDYMDYDDDYHDDFYDKRSSNPWDDVLGSDEADAAYWNTE